MSSISGPFGSPRGSAVSLSRKSWAPGRRRCFCLLLRRDAPPPGLLFRREGHRSAGGDAAARRQRGRTTPSRRGTGGRGGVTHRRGGVEAQIQGGATHRLGGHTAEMMNVVTTLQKDRFTPRYYVAALTDNMSLQKAQVYEQSLVRVEVDKEEGVENAQFVQIYRSREVGQSYITSIATTLLATSHAIWIIIRIRPQVIFCNGPGTCIPLCISAFLLKVLGLGWSSIFYIESIARVKKLSLSGLLLYKLRIADQFFVQWPQLQQKYPRACYAGRLISSSTLHFSFIKSKDIASFFHANVRDLLPFPIPFASQSSHLTSPLTALQATLPRQHSLPCAAADIFAV
uniref:UDP-N-acetylglucosamine transferase subunit ALG14 n=1 Tax=Oryza glumipatula TaxID=40148 RepID=A0A0D9Z7C8_9ORYZ